MCGRPKNNTNQTQRTSLEHIYSRSRRQRVGAGVGGEDIGDPASRTAGRHFRGVLERLRSAGFDARTVPGAFGVSAIAR